MKSKLILVITVALVIVLADHSTKWWIVQNLSFTDKIPVIPNIFDIVHTRNTGAAFGFLSGWHSPLRDWFFYGIGLLAFFFLYHYVKSTPAGDRLTLIALALITGGAIGNLSDRMWRGSVVDFLSVHYYQETLRFSVFGSQIMIPLIWPAFNVADSAICIGVTVLIIQNFRNPSDVR